MKLAILLTLGGVAMTASADDVRIRDELQTKMRAIQDARATLKSAESEFLLAVDTAREAGIRVDYQICTIGQDGLNRFSTNLSGPCKDEIRQIFRIAEIP